MACHAGGRAWPIIKSGSAIGAQPKLRWRRAVPEWPTSLRGVSAQVRASAGARTSGDVRNTRGRANRWRWPVRSKLTPAAAREVELLVAEGLTLHAIGERLGVHRRTILRWVERDADFRQRYERARRFAHELLYDELREVIVRPAVSRGEIYAARRSIMRRAPTKYGRLPPELRPRLLY